MTDSAPPRKHGKNAFFFVIVTTDIATAIPSALLIVEIINFVVEEVEYPGDIAGVFAQAQVDIVGHFLSDIVVVMEVGMVTRMQIEDRTHFKRATANVRAVGEQLGSTRCALGVGQ